MVDRPTRVIWIDAGLGLAVPSCPGIACEPVADLDAALARLKESGWEAVVIAATAEQARQLRTHADWVAAWRDTPVLLVAPLDDDTEAVRMAEAGLQDIVHPSQASASELTLRLALAVARKQRERDARRTWSTDLDTGLPNRDQLLEHLNQLLALRARQPSAMALVVVRVTGLDSARAQQGDEAVHMLRRKLAVRLRGAVRASDVVASLGADGFALLLTKIESPDDATRVSAKLTRLVRDPFRLTAGEVRLVPHVGQSVTPRDGSEAAHLLACALEAARLAQSTGARGAANDP
jgi:diguanylate cyclase (GGDEF)-like protein